MPTSKYLPDLKDRASLVPSTPRGIVAPSRPSHLRWVAFFLVVVCAYAAGNLNPAIYPGRENQFVASWVSWSQLRERDVKKGTTGADTIIMWKVVKSRFKDLDKSLNY